LTLTLIFPIFTDGVRNGIWLDLVFIFVAYKTDDSAYMRCAPTASILT